MHNYHFSALGAQDLAEMMEIEQAVYTHPWTIGNFSDSLLSTYILQGLRDSVGKLCGYFVLMPVYEEIHLLNIAVATENQNTGLGRLMLNHIRVLVLEMKFLSILLEVRASAQKTIHLYHSAGYREIGRRKAYYPVNPTGREDAIVMRLEL